MQLGLGLGLTKAGGLTLTQRAISILRRYGTDAHVYLPGVGVVSGLTAGNYIDTAGTQSASVNDPVGLVLDASATVGPEIFNAANVQLNAGWASNGDGSYTKTPGSASTLAINGNALASGVYARLSFEVVSISGGSFTPFISGQSTGVAVSTTGTKTYNAQAGSSAITDATLSADATVSCTIRAISIRELVGSIPGSQGTTANKPILRQSSGRYSWQFDGSNDSLALASVPFQVADDHVVIFGARPDSSTADRTVYSHRSTVAGNPVFPSLRWTRTATKWQVIYRDDAASATVTLNETGTTLLGVTAVAASRKLGNTYSLWKDGSLQASATQAFGAINVNSVLIGADGTGTPAQFFAGMIFPGVVIKGSVSDADLITLQKWIGSMSGVTL